MKIRKQLETKRRLGELEELPHHFNELYQRLSNDRDSWAVTGGDLAQVVDELQKQIKGFATVEEKFKHQLTSFIKQETRQAGDKVANHWNNSSSPSWTSSPCCWGIRNVCWSTTMR